MHGVGSGRDPYVFNRVLIAVRLTKTAVHVTYSRVATRDEDERAWHRLGP